MAIRAFQFLFLIAVSLQVSATPANKTALSKHLGPFFPAALDSCAACHVKADPHGAESLKDFPHNDFGKALHKLGRKTKLTERLLELAEQDADGDGADNLTELLAGSRPGDAKSKPALTSDKLKSLQDQFAKFSERYPWQPFETVKRPAVPDIDTGRNAIDRFVVEKQQTHQLNPRPEAPRDLLLRRVYLDLIGLAPTPKERAAFLNDPSPRAYEDVVNQLLERPEYGERWARHWMDIWRYSDWAGYKAALRDSQRHIWHWRDWIIESLNDDKPYDQMLREMMAADELHPGDYDKVRATGYLARHYFANRQQWMDNVVTHTSQAFLGITLGCSKCHDHMYDDLPQQDYYAMRAVFESYNVRTDRVPGQLDIMKNGIPRAYDQSVTAKTYLFERGDERRRNTDKVIIPAAPASLNGKLEIKPISLPRLAHRPERRQFVIDDMMAAANKLLANAKTPPARKSAELKLAALKAELAAEKIEESGQKSSKEWKAAAEETTRLQREAAVADAKALIDKHERDKQQAETEMKEAKNATAKTKASRRMKTANTQIVANQKKLTSAEKVMKGKPSTKYKSRATKTYLSSSSGRRSAFAKWLSSKQNPLTARVAMNHIWLRHFGQPIVPTVNEFGANGREPTHPALLDWLAAEFMDRGWSMKEMHRLIVASATYRQSATTDSHNQKIDPDNKWLWRWPSRRMEGEIVRDNVLHVAGTMDRSFGGPDIDNKLAQKSKRRSIYLRHAHEKLVEFVQIFDGPKVSECYMREESVQPHQALALANSPLTFDQAAVLSKELSDRSKDDRAFVRNAYLHILSREPRPEEQELCEEFMKKPDAKKRLVMTLFNHNDFVTIR
ncbi:MAG: DUF1549 and DUF1553 domain-containing protein [Limisphaerales bacterium]